jgi:hypothetical protein
MRCRSADLQHIQLLNGWRAAGPITLLLSAAYRAQVQWHCTPPRLVQCLGWSVAACTVLAARSVSVCELRL